MPAREAPDPYTMGKAKLAEFWPTYVKEADLYDKELSDGWNKLSVVRRLILYLCTHNLRCDQECWM